MNATRGHFCVNMGVLCVVWERVWKEGRIYGIITKKIVVRTII